MSVSRAPVGTSGMERPDPSRRNSSARRKANVRLAIILALVALALYLGGFFFYLQ